MQRITSLLAILLGILSACAPARQEPPYVLTYATPYPPTHPFSRADIEWMQHVERASGGRITFRPYWSGSLISSDMSMTEIAHGVADIGLITPIYARGGANMLRAQSGFYGGVRNITDQVAIYDCLNTRFPAFSQELRGLHVLAVQGGNFPGIVTRDRPINTLEDLRGLRLRTPNENVEVLRRLGADPVNMPMGEVYPALAKGVIDGVIAPGDTIRSLHFSEVARHFTTIRFSRGAYPARAMSDIAWRRLPPDLQQLLIASKSVWEAALNRQLLAAEEAGFSYGRSEGIDFRAIAPEEQARFDELYNEVAVQQARGLSEMGLDGEPVLAEAQRLVHMNPVRCEAGQISGNPQ